MAQILYIIAGLHVILCPFTKVEESFNIQASHDILYHRHNLSQYDHNEFPGVVPRTFVGALVTSLLSAPLVGVMHLTGISKFCIQYVVRLTLALTIVAAWSRLRNTLHRQFGTTFAWWFTVITVTQYHFMFYMSRPLPNIMAMPLVLLAFEGWLSGNHKQFLVSAGASIVIFRSELAVLFGLFLLIDLQAKKITIQNLLKIVVPAGAALVALSVVVDSIFWRRLLWPEAEVFWFNTFMNKSSDWGTSPFLWYWYSALPRGLGPSLVLVPLGLHLERRLASVAAPALAFVALLSCLPHKELRFIVYVFPLLNMASAAACSYIYTRRSKAPIFELLFWGVVVVVVGNMLLSLAFVSVAVNNYPGGVAITRFHKLVKDEPFVHLHICNLAAQTGVTRFTQINDHWMYSKNESLRPDQLMEYTHLLVESKSKYSSNLKYFANTHVILDSVEMFSHISMNSKFFPPIKIKTKPAIFILERKDFKEYPKRHWTEIDTSYLSEDSESGQMSGEEEKEEVVRVTNYNEAEDEREDLIEPETTAEKDEISKMPETIEETIVDDAKIKEDSDTIIASTKEIEVDDDAELTQHQKPEEIVEDIKALRRERKRKAIAKIKSETRKEVVASAKEKLKELMKRHKHIAEELSVNIAEEEAESKEVDGGGDVPDDNLDIEEPEEVIADVSETDKAQTVKEFAQTSDVIRNQNQNVNAIVEEVIARLIDRKIYDDKTKPEDIKAEDRQVIQQIVEEVLNERIARKK